MKWIVLKQSSDSPKFYEHVGAAETRDLDDPLARTQLESEAIRQVAVSAGVYAAIMFDDWSLHEAEARIVTHPVPRAAPEETQEPEITGAPDVTARETELDDMEGLVQPGGHLR